jgi:hypothetical protein
VAVTDRPLERGHEVYLADAEQRTIRVSLQPSWGLVPGSRWANSTRWFATRTQTADTATSSLGIVGSAIAGAVWMVLVSARWMAYQARRRRDWTVSVSSYEEEPVKLAGRRDAVHGRTVRTLEHSQHRDYESALSLAKQRASALAQDGYRPLPYPVGWGSR